MAVTILRPATVAETWGPWSAVPSGTLTDVLSDGSDATWAEVLVYAPGGPGMQVWYESPSLPPGARVARVRLASRANVSAPLGGAAFLIMSWSDRPVLTGTIQQYESSWQTTDPWGSPWTPQSIADYSVYIVMEPYQLPYPTANLYDTWLEVEYHERPEVTVTAPSPTVTDTTRPTIRWDYSQVDGLPQSQWRAGVAIGTLNVWDSGWQHGDDDSVQIPVDLENDTSYDVYMHVRAQWGGQGHLESSIVGPADRTFTLDLDTPAAPDVQVTPHPDDARTLVEIAAVAGDVATGWFSVQHRDSDDGPWVTLRAGGHLDATDGPVAIFDHEAPFNVARTYRVRAHAEVGAEQVASPPTDIAATLELEGRWLTDPRDPESLNLEVSTREHSRSLQGREQVHMPAGMSIAVVESEPAVLHQSLSVWALDPQEHETLYAALRSTRTLLYRDWRSTVYFRWVGDRTAQQHAKDFHNIDVLSGTMVEVARPAT